MIRQVLFITFLFGCAPSHGVRNDINLDVYQELCGFIQTLETKPEFPKITFEPSDERSGAFSVSELLLAIETFNVSTADDDVFERLAQGESFDQASKNPVVANYIGKKVWGWLLNAWGKKQRFINNGTLQRFGRPPNPKARARAHRHIGKLVKMAWNTANQLLALGVVMENNAYLSRRHMYAAIYGKNAVAKWINPGGLIVRSVSKLYGNVSDPVAVMSRADVFGPSDSLGFLNMDYFSKVTLQTDSFGNGQGTYARVCGGAGTGGTYPGTSIISDMTCLCLSGSNSGDYAGQYCGPTVGQQLDVSVDFNLYKLPLAGTALKTACGLYTNNATKVKPTPAALQTIATRLLGMLGKKGVTGSYSYSDGYSYGSSYGSSSTGTTNQNFARFILGVFATGSGTIQCDGATDSPQNLYSGGNCVNYAILLASGQEIPWIVEVKQAAEKLKENEKLFMRQVALHAEIETFVKMAGSSLNDAWEEPEEPAPTSLRGPATSTPDAPGQQDSSTPPDTTAWFPTPLPPRRIPPQASVAPPPTKLLKKLLSAQRQRATRRSLIPVSLLALGAVIF
ncbi:unnamed protein product [Trypanosoma congolense IL3000]|uniref:WGS project CAEQ00000000 data, annotated contig 1949 n=1 Tax=Trypanosoma congolense (strain IL3000) TaxID=1068625 RepID=F9WA92_TRYCI|nr:unnamed protein product [Trypanosoma congolense IL3000]